MSRAGSMLRSDSSIYVFGIRIEDKLDGVGPVDNRPSTAEAPPIGKINPLSKIAVTFKPAMQFGCPL